MKELKKLKKELKKSSCWKDYKKAFAHRQMRFLISKIILIYSPGTQVESLVKFELSMLNATSRKYKNMFANVFEKIGEVISTKANWIEFGIFVYYVYQTSTFYQDKKNGIDNIFINNEIKGNDAKRKHFYNWMHSMDITIADLNKNIIAVQKVVF